MKRIALLGLLILLGAGPATKPAAAPVLKKDAPAYAKWYFEKAMAAKAARRKADTEAVRLAKVELQQKKSGRIDATQQDDERHLPSGGWAYRSKDVKADKLKEAGDKVAAAEARLGPGFIPPVSLEHDDVKMGVAGHLGGKLLQVIDDNDAIVSVTFTWIISGPGENASGTYPTQLIWLADFPTKDLVDGTRVDGVFRIDGTKRYTTAAGAESTILRAEPFSVDEWIEKPAAP